MRSGSLIAVLLLQLTMGCGVNPTDIPPPQPAEGAGLPDEVTQPESPDQVAASDTDGVWFLDATVDESHTFHLLGEPFRVGVWGFILSVENERPACINPHDGPSAADGVSPVWRRASTARPVTVNGVTVSMRFKMDFEPTWFDVFDELRGERIVEVEISGFQIDASPGMAVYDVTVDRFYVISGHTTRATGTLSRFDTEPWFTCE